MCTLPFAWAMGSIPATKQPHPPFALELQLVNAVGMYAEWLDAVSFTCRRMQPFSEESHPPASSFAELLAQRVRSRTLLQKVQPVPKFTVTLLGPVWLMD